MVMLVFQTMNAHLSLIDGKYPFLFRVFGKSELGCVCRFDCFAFILSLNQDYYLDHVM